MALRLPLRFVVPALIMLFSVAVTTSGYLVVCQQIEDQNAAKSLHLINMEMNKLQGLLEYALREKSINLIRQIHGGKLSETNLKALTIVQPNGEIVASTRQRDIGKQWQNSVLLKHTDIIEKTLREQRTQTVLHPERQMIESVVSICTNDFSVSLRRQNCGFLFYQIDLTVNLDTAISALQTQSLYFVTAIALGLILLIITLDVLINRRLTTIHRVLKHWRTGNRTIRISPTGRDEISEIGYNIDRLLEKFAEDEEALIYNQQLTEAVIQSANYSMIITDTHGVITAMNATAQQLLGYRESELKGLQMPAAFHDPEEITQRAQKLSEKLNDTINPDFDCFVAIACRGGIDENNWTYIRKDGTRIKVRLSVSAILNPDGELKGFLGVAHDISEEVKTAEKLENMAYFDQLTQLPNRVLYRDRLKQAIFQAKRIKNQVAVLFLDLDKFKDVNDTHGHEIGDRLLIEVAKILQQQTRESDTVCRLGGDEFTIILSNVHGQYLQHDISRICEKIIKAIYQPIMIDEVEINIGVSIGIAIYPENGSSITQLNKAADVAMYAAKDAGRGCYRFYSKEMSGKPM